MCVCFSVRIWRFLCVFLYKLFTMLLWLGLIVPGPEYIACQNTVSPRKQELVESSGLKSE